MGHETQKVKKKARSVGLDNGKCPRNLAKKKKMPKAPQETKDTVKEPKKVTPSVQDGDTKEQKQDEDRTWSLSGELRTKTRESIKALIGKYITTITKRKGARKTHAIKEVTVQLLAQGLNFSQIARIFGFDRSYLGHLKAKDDEFSGRCKAAKMDLLELMEGTLSLNALKSSDDPRYQSSLFKQLTALDRDKYGDRQSVHHTDSYSEMVEAMDPAHLLRLIKANALDLDSYKPQDLLPVIDVDPVEAEHETTYRPRENK